MFSGSYYLLFLPDPVILSGQQANPWVLTDLSAQAWVTLDDMCILQYGVIMSNNDVKQTGVLKLYLTTNSGQKWITLEDGFVGRTGSGYLNNLSPELLDDLNEGDAQLVISDKSHPSGLLATQVHEQCNGSNSILQKFGFNYFVNIRGFSKPLCQRFGKNFANNSSLWNY